MAGALHGTTLNGKGQRLAIHLERTMERPLFPLLQIAHEAKPRASAGGLEHLLVVGWLGGLQEEHFDERTRLLAEMQTSLGK